MRLKNNSSPTGYILLLIAFAFIIVGGTGIYTSKQASIHTLQNAEDSSAQSVEVLPQILSNDPVQIAANSVKIEVKTTFNVSSIQIEYGEKITDLNRKKASSSSTLEITSMQPDTQYFFKTTVIDKNNSIYTSGVGTFTTLP